ncbi:MAG: TolC family protein [Acidobacteria bacterium]|nr:TolC family protein [Acidobacteriota bacterium]
MTATRAAVLLLSACAAFADAPAPDTAPLTLDQAMEIALAHNPTLAAARLSGATAAAQIGVASERPNPALTIEEDRETPKDSLTLSFPVEVAGKRGKRVDVAEAGRRSADAAVAAAIADTRVAVRRAFYGLAAAERRAEELQAIRDLAARTSAAAKDRFESGAAPRLDLLQAELAGGDAQNGLREARARIAAAGADLNTVLGRTPGEPVSVATGLDAAEQISADTATSIALASSAELAIANGRVEEARARVTLARAQRIPDPVLDAAVTHRGEPDFDWGWRAAVSFELPLFTTHRALVAAESAALSQAMAERDALDARIRGDVFSAQAVAAASREQYMTFRDEMLPRVAEVEKMAEDSYRSGQTGLVAMLQALQTARDLRLRAVQAGLDYQLAVADLERAMGAPLP